MDGVLGLADWRWLFLIETLPLLLLGWATLHVLVDTPAEAQWLSAAERAWLGDRLRAESARHPAAGGGSVRATLMNGSVLALSACYFGVEFALYGVILWVPQILAKAGSAWAAPDGWWRLPTRSRPSAWSPGAVTRIERASACGTLAILPIAWTLPAARLSGVAAAGALLTGAIALLIRPGRA